MPERRRRRMFLIAAIAIAFSIAAVAVGVLWSAGSTDESDTTDASVAPRERLTAAGRALDELARRERGQVGYALTTLRQGEVTSGGEIREEQAWSAIKVPLAAAFLGFRRETLRAGSGTAVLSGSDARLVREAITVSSNGAARRMFSRMVRGEGQASALARVEAMLRKGGDERTRVVPGSGRRPQLGATRWRIEDALGWYRELARGRLLPPVDTDLIVRHMHCVLPEQRWGVPEVAEPAAFVAFKSGWGPNDDLNWLVEQFAIVGQGENAYVIGLMVRPVERSKSLADPRSYDAGRALLRRAAEVAHSRLSGAGLGPPPSAPCRP